MGPDESINQLVSRLAALGVRGDQPFQQPELIQQALTHSSFAAEHGTRHNERLEMLGDAVLGLVVAELLYDLLPAAPEGVLTRRRASLVDKESFARQARKLGLAELLLLGKGEEASRGRERDSLLADAFEALTAAIYLSEGLPVAAALVGALLREEAIARAGSSPHADDYKTTLQEQAQAKWKAQPVYQVASTTGPDHDPTFVCEARIGTVMVGSGEGRSKKIAEQRAAKAALDAWDSLVALIDAERGAGPG